MIIRELITVEPTTIAISLFGENDDIALDLILANIHAKIKNKRISITP